MFSITKELVEMLSIMQSEYLPSSITTIDFDGNRIPNNETTERTKAIKFGVDRSLSHLKEPSNTLLCPSIDRKKLFNILLTVHSANYIRFLESCSLKINAGDEILQHDFNYPNCAPETYISANTWESCIRTAEATYYGALRHHEQQKVSYIHTRPPGHHAGFAWMGGFCFINNAVLAAKRLNFLTQDKVGILDVDFHYGNGTADIVGGDDYFHFISLHQDRKKTYPFSKEKINHANIQSIDFRSEPTEREYLHQLQTSLNSFREKGIKQLVVSIGYDTCEGDPYGGWTFQPSIYKSIGKMLYQSGLKLMIVQEGGYNLSSLQDCSYEFVIGLHNG